MMQSVIRLKSDARPLYIRTVDALYHLLESGAYAPGQMLPSEDVLSRQLGVSRSTIRESLSHLEKDGTIVRRQGIGTFVADRSELLAGGLERLATFRSVAEMSGAIVDVVERQVDLIPASPELAARLGVEPGTVLVRLVAVEAMEKQPVAYMEGLIRKDLVDFDRLQQATGSLLEYLDTQSSLPIAYSRSEISAIDADSDLAERLRVDEGRSVLYLWETVFSDADQPIALFRNFFFTDNYRFKIVRRVVRHPVLHNHKS